MPGKIPMSRHLPLDDEQMFVPILKETIHEEIAEKLLLELKLALRYVDVKISSPDENKEYNISFSVEIDLVDDLTLPQCIHLTKRGLDALFLKYKEDDYCDEVEPIECHIKKSYTKENIHEIFDEVVYSIDEWITRNIRIIEVKKAS